jgi:phosphatidylinositol glycan class B
MGTTTRSLGKGLWIGLFALRALNAVFVQTYFDPDEYWQTIEVAHHAVFSYGWLSWEWTVGLRSILSLLPFMAYFQILRLLSVDSDIAVVYNVYYN